MRLRAAGWATAAAPDAVGVHLGSATYGHRSERQRRYGGFGRAYLMRRYGLLRRRAAARTLLTEAIVVAGDAVISRDLAALQGRIAGWRAAGGLPKHAFPPDERDRPRHLVPRVDRPASRRVRRVTDASSIPERDLLDTAEAGPAAIRGGALRAIGYGSGLCSRSARRRSSSAISASSSSAATRRCCRS